MPTRLRLDKNDFRPLFKQVADGVRDQIESGALQAGDELASERDLVEQLGISRMTVRAALDELEREGLVVRQHGRKTVVAGIKIRKNALGFMSFTEDMRARGLQASSRLLRLEAEPAEAGVAAQLGLDAGERVIRAERVRLADGEPMAFEQCFLPYARFPKLLSQDLAHQSLYEVLEREFGCHPALAEETIEAVLIDAQEARLLGVAWRSPALRAQRLTRDEQGQVFEAVRTLYRADRYRMVFVRRRPGN
jgi:GntR family transcriptional regulator